MASCRVRGVSMSQMYANSSRVSSIYSPLPGIYSQVYDSTGLNLQSLDNKGVAGRRDSGLPLESGG